MNAAFDQAFDADRALRLLNADRPWTADDFVCAGIYFRDYGKELVRVFKAAQDVSGRFGPDQVRLTRDQRYALDELAASVAGLVPATATEGAGRE